MRQREEEIPLHARPWLTIPQTMRLMGKGRAWVEARIASGEFMTIQDEQREKVYTKSVIAWVDRQAAEQLHRVGLQKAA